MADTIVPDSRWRDLNALLDLARERINRYPSLGASVATQACALEAIGYWRERVYEVVDLRKSSN